jgi:hypothetical protein
MTTQHHHGCRGKHAAAVILSASNLKGERP